MSYRFVLPFADVGNGIDPSAGARLSFFDFGTLNPKTTFSDFALTNPNTNPLIADADGLFSDIYLDTKASVSLQNENLVPIWGPKEIYAPDDSIQSLAALFVTVLDAGGNFDAVNVETVLAEIASDYFRTNRAETITAAITMAASINMQDNVLQRPQIRDYSIKHDIVSSVSGVLTLDMASANSFGITLTENITSIVVSNAPASGRYGEFVLRITQDSVSSFTVAEPSGTIIPGAATYAMSTGADARDKLTFSTEDAGTSWDLDFSQAYG